MAPSGVWRRRTAAALIVTIAMVATLALAGDALFGRRLYFEGDRVVAADAWERAMRFAWFEEEAALEGDDRSPTVHDSELMFSRRTGGIHDLFRSRARGPAEPLFELSGPTHDVDPVFLEDGRVVVFASDRPGGHGGYDLYVAVREGEGFGAPRNLGPSINTECDERHPDTPDGKSLVFLSDRLSEDGRLEPWSCSPVDGTFDEPTPFALPGLEDVVLRGFVFEPSGTGMILCAATPAGDLDLYRSRRLGGQWSAPKRLDDLCTEEDEIDPALSAEGGRLYFARTVPGSSGTATRLATALRREIIEHREPAPPIWRYLLHVLAPLLIALALTYLWLKWGRIHPFIKFLILSLVAHLVLMMWVDPLPAGSGETESGGGRSYRVQWIAQPSSSPASMAARGDVVPSPTAAQESVEASRAAPSESASPSAAAPTATGARREAVAQAVPAAESLPAPSRSSRSSSDAAETPSASRDVNRRSGADAAPAIAAAGGVASARVTSEPGAARSRVSEATSESRAAHRPAAGSASRRVVAVAAPALESEAVAQRGSRRAAASPAAAPAADGVRSERDGASDPQSAQLTARASGVSPVATDSRATRSERMAVTAERRGGPAPVAPPTDLIRRSGSRPTAPVVDAVALGSRLDRPTPAFRLSDGQAVRREEPAAMASAEASARPRDIGLLSRRQAAPASSRRRQVSQANPGAARSPLRPPVTGMMARRSRRTSVKGPAAISPRPSTLARRRSAAPAASSAKRVRSAMARGGRQALQPRPLSVRKDQRLLETSGRRAVGVGLVLSSWPAPPDLLRRRDVAFMAAARPKDVPYAARRGRAKLEAIRISGGSDETEAAVLAGLRYLSRRQRQDGGWGRESMHEKYREVRIGKSGLALLAFLGAGATHTEGGEFREVIEDGLAFLLGRQDRRTGHVGDGSSYSHGIATYAVAEAYAMTKDAGLRRPLERAVARILRAQVSTPGRSTDGGWGYYYRDPQRSFDDWPRLSVTAWQIMALESARIGGLEVDDEVLERARNYVAGSLDAELEAMRYSHDPAWKRNRYPTLPGSNAAAAFVLQLTGLPADDPRVRLTLDYINARPPSFRWRRASADDFVNRGHANLYFHYYAALAMHRAGGDNWSRWNEKLKPQLLQNQEQDGSWIPVSAYADYAGDSDQDRVYTTALGVMTLEVYYRYFTPLLRSARSQEEGGEETYVEIVEVTGRRARALGLRQGDRIVLVGSRVVNSLASLENAIETLRQGRNAPLIIRRKGRQIVRVLRGRLSGLRVGEFVDTE